MQLCETQIVLSDLGDIGDHHVHVHHVSVDHVHVHHVHIHVHHDHVHHVHEWERLRGLGGGEKDGTEENEMLPRGQTNKQGKIELLSQWTL